MKTLKIALYAVLGIIGFVNASASAGKYVVGTIYHWNGSSYVAVTPTDYSCEFPTENVTCTYKKDVESLPISAPGNAIRNQSGTYVPNL